MAPNVSQALHQVAGHPRCKDLARLTRDCLFEAVGSPSLDLTTPVAKRAAACELSRDNANLEIGNVIDALAAPTSAPNASVLLGSLLAYALALEPPQTADAERATAIKLAWLATHAGIDAFAALDSGMGDQASRIWNATADLVLEHDTKASGVGLADAIVAAAALAATDNETATQRRVELASCVKNPMLERILHSSGGATAPDVQASLVGELATPPRGPVATFFMGLFGWLLVSHIVRLFGRFALQYRRPAEVSITAQGVRVRSTTKLLGKVVRENETLIPLEGLARATREIRFPRLGTYAGLVALAVGSFVGVSWFIDGLRTASFSLALVGLLIVLGGVALDFALVSLLPGRKGRCRVVFVPRRGASTCVGWVDATQADLLLKGLSRG